MKDSGKMVKLFHVSKSAKHLGTIVNGVSSQTKTKLSNVIDFDVPGLGLYCEH